MINYTIKPVSDENKRQLLKFLKQNQFRFVFYAYGTHLDGMPHHALHVDTDNPRLMALIDIALSEYILCKNTKLT
mgnify:CR=1 FL=1|jgi:hypothetical protein